MRISPQFRPYVALSFVLLALSVVGCTGSGSSASGSLSPYVGNYQGTFTTSNSQNGTITGVLSAGSVGNTTASGTAHNATTLTDSTITGLVQTGGDADLTFTTGGTSTTFTGTVAFASNGHLKGTLVGGTLFITVNIDLAKQ